ncbi:hypothetical protein [Massilia sp. HP4]|uniref:hypothetical protein n=1 Tax=Massilia sp. HP4 TaxID=2562316 RepID=UPI0010C0C01D|nr:hypothetical protein [Massilia sp. HP4]
MTSHSLPFGPAAGRRSDRFTGIVLTLAVHLALILAWQAAGKLPAMPQAGSDEAMQWLLLPALAPRAEIPVPEPEKIVRRQPGPAPVRAHRSDPVPAPTVQEAPAPAPAPPVVDQQAGTMPGAADILANARRSVGEIDRALRKENRPLIVAPPDSAHIRMREGMEHARAMAPPRMWEAPKVEELVNNTGDGARRTRVITGRRTYCVTERAPTTNVEMIEMHGKQRFTNCPTHEEPARQQVWRTARD